MTVVRMSPQAADQPKRVIFLDRDGTIIADRHYLHRIEQVDLLPGAADGLRLLEGAGFALVVATNQSGVARGRFAENDVHTVNEYLRTLLAEQGVRVSGFFFCPHHPEGSVPEYAILCSCRKPEAGMAEQTEALQGPIDYARSWSIGDKPTDVQFGQKKRMKTALLRSEYWAAPPDPKPDLIVNSLQEAAQKIRTQK